MGRRTATWKRTTCAKGINQEVEQSSFEECADALNVWAPDGRVEQRPGFLGRGFGAALGTGGNVGAGVVIYEDRTAPASVFSSTFPIIMASANLQSATYARGDRIYLGAPVDAGTGVLPAGFNGYQLTLPVLNTASSYAKLEYWNGTNWVWVSGSQTKEVCIAVDGVLSANPTYVFVAPPADWATNTIDNITGVGSTTPYYFARMTLFISEAGVTTLTAGTRINSVLCLGDTGSVQDHQMFVAQFNTVKRYFAILTDPYANQLLVSRKHDLINATYTQTDDARTPSNVPAQADYAVVPITEEVYITTSARTFYFKGIENYNPADAHEILYSLVPLDRRAYAQVEARDFAVGFDGKYATDLVAQLTGFPQSKYITYFKNRLWVANLESNFSGVRWSAPLPYHNVWPSGQIEYLIENDNSPITGMYGFGEHVRIFKQNSIWALVDVGADANELLSIAPIKSEGAAGVGCVSQRSIQEIKGHLFFLAEDGVYAFDGVKVEKLSDRIDKTIQRLSTAFWARMVAVHWRTQRLYLLAVSLDGAPYNDHVLAFDYANNSWWIWDNMEVTSWLLDEDTADKERLYFIDRYARVYEMDFGYNDYGEATETSITTQRAGFRDSSTKRLRHVYAHGDNRMGDVTVQAIPDDDTINTNGRVGTMAFAANTEIGLRQKRVRRNDFRVDGRNMQVKLSHGNKAKKFVMDLLEMGFNLLGRR